MNKVNRKKEAAKLLMQAVELSMAVADGSEPEMRTKLKRIERATKRLQRSVMRGNASVVNSADFWKSVKWVSKLIVKYLINEN